MTFRASFCDPLKRDIIELGIISKDKIIETFENTPWSDYLLSMKSAKEDEIYFSPSLEVENKDNHHGLAISAVGEPNNYEFYVFYKRPKIIRTFFGLKEKMKNDYISNATGQTKDNVIDCLNALIRNDTLFLENAIGE